MGRIIIALVMVSFFSCKKNGNEATIYDSNVYLLYKNDKGENILNGNGAGAVNTDDIDVYIIKSGLKTRVYDESRDYKENFRVYLSPVDGNLLNFFFKYDNDTVVDDKVVMFIRYKDGTEDKLIGEFNSRAHSPNMIIKKIWINDVLRWERVPEGPNGIIELIK